VLVWLAAVLAAGCSGGDEGAPGEAGGAPQENLIRVPPRYKVVDSLFLTSVGSSAGEKLRRKIGDAQAGRALLAVAGGGAEPVRTLASGFDWAVAEHVARGRIRILVPGITAAKVVVTVDGKVVWQHEKDAAEVLSPEIDLEPPAASASRPSHPVLIIHVEGTGLHGTGGVTDVLILRSRVAAATAPAGAP